LETQEQSGLRLLEQRQIYETPFMVLDNKDFEEQLALVIKLKSVPDIQSMFMVVETYLTPIERIWNKYGTWIFLAVSLILASIITVYTFAIVALVSYKLYKHFWGDAEIKSHTN
jgi:ABC-type glycerol-3-phosphate transport system permease component